MADWTTPTAIHSKCGEKSGAEAIRAIVCDVTALVDASGSTYYFKWLVDSDNAGAVNYTSNFVLVIIYSM